MDDKIVLNGVTYYKQNDQQHKVFEEKYEWLKGMINDSYVEYSFEHDYNKKWKREYYKGYFAAIESIYEQMLCIDQASDEELFDDDNSTMTMDNTLIEKFAEQSKKYAFNEMKKVTNKEETIKTHSNAYDNKFAELIINEAILFIENGYERNFNNLWRKDIANQLKEHFNIK